MADFRHALWCVLRSVVDASGYNGGAGPAGVALRMFLREPTKRGVQLSLFSGWPLSTFFAQSEHALHAMEEEIRIGIRRTMPLEVFGQKLHPEVSVAVLALDVSLARERQEKS